MQSLSIDEVYDIIGHLGYAQFSYFIILSSIQIFTAEHMLLNIYTGLEPSFTCYAKGTAGKIKNYSNNCFENSVSKCSLEFHDSITTIASEWSLVCNDKYKVALVQSIWMGGVMSGALFLSGLADRFGRLRTLMLSIMCTIAFESLSALSSSYLIFVALRFIGGMACSLVILVSFVLSQELIGSSRRSVCAIVLTMFFSFGIALLSAIAAYTTNWRSIAMLSSMSGVVLLFIPFTVPESPRWLAGRGRLKAAKMVLEAIAEKNGTAQLLPSHWDIAVAGQEKDVHKNEGVCALASHPYVFKLTLIQIYSWFVNSAVYYALTMAASKTSTGENVYWATTLNGFVEIPAYTSSIFIIERFGRRFTICFFMLLAGFLCTVIPLVPSSAVSTLALVGKLGISASFSVIYLHSGEIFPTVIRNAAMGVVSVAARIGGIVSPFVLMLGDLHPNLHFVVLGLATFFAGIFNAWLPETLGRPLPETVADIIALGSRKGLHKIKSKSNEKAYQKLRQDSDDDEEEGSRVRPLTSKVREQIISI